MNYLELLKVIPPIVSTVLDLVQRVETPGVDGKLKKQAVMDVVKASLDGIAKCGISAPATVILTIADYAVDAVVTAFNILGVFKKKEGTPIA